MFEHEKYTPVDENRVLTEFIKQMNRINGPEWFVPFLSAADEIRYVKVVKIEDHATRIAKLADFYVSTARQVFTDYRSILICFWRALQEIGIEEITYTEEETRNMKLWLDLQQQGPTQ